MEIMVATSGVRNLIREGKSEQLYSLVETGAHLAWSAVLRVYFAAWHRLRIESASRLPAEPPFVIAANHSSHLDALALTRSLPWRLNDRVFPLAAGDVFFSTPAVAGFAAFVMNALPLWRRNCGAHAMDAQDHGFMYSRAFYDLDGHHWEVLWFDPVAAS